MICLTEILDSGWEAERWRQEGTSAICWWIEFRSERISGEVKRSASWLRVICGGRRARLISSKKKRSRTKASEIKHCGGEREKEMLKEIIIKTLWLATCQFFFREETDEAAVSSASHDFIGAPPTFSIWSYRFICFLNNRREKAGKREMKEEEEKEKEKGEKGGKGGFNLRRL